MMTISTLKDDSRVLASGDTISRTKRRLDKAIINLDHCSAYGKINKLGQVQSHEGPVAHYKISPRLQRVLSARKSASSKGLRKPVTAPDSSSGHLQKHEEFLPCSKDALIDRLSTYSLRTYSDKPVNIDPLRAAMRGWRNKGGRDRLECGICQAAFLVKGVESGATRWASHALVKKYASMLQTAHLVSCPWRNVVCDPALYKLDLSSAQVAMKELIDRAATLIEVASVMLIQPVMTEDEELALGKALQHTLTHRTSSLSLSSYRKVQVVIRTKETTFKKAVYLALLGWQSASSSKSDDKQVIHCVMCHAQCGTWLYARDRAFRGLDEHRVYCPYARLDWLERSKESSRKAGWGKLLDLLIAHRTPIQENSLPLQESVATPGIMDKPSVLQSGRKRQAGQQYERSELIGYVRSLLDSRSLLL